MKQLLSEEGSDINAINSTGDSLLMVAAKNKRNECIKALVESGADVNKKGGAHGNTALHECTLLGNSAQSTVELLLSFGCSPNKKNDKGQTAYALATEKGYDALVTSMAVNLGQEMLDKLSDQKMSLTDEINF